MPYHPLTNETGGSPEQRRAEADRLVKMINDLALALTDREAAFVDDISDPDRPVSPKQLFWLRDIKERYE